MECRYKYRTKQAMNYASQVGFHVRKLRDHGYDLTNIDIDKDWITCNNLHPAKCSLKYKTISIPVDDEIVTLVTTYQDVHGDMRTQTTTGRTKLYSREDYKEYKYLDIKANRQEFEERQEEYKKNRPNNYIQSIF